VPRRWGECTNKLAVRCRIHGNSQKNPYCRQCMMRQPWIVCYIPTKYRAVLTQNKELHRHIKPVFNHTKFSQIMLLSILIRSNKMQQYAGIYLLQIYSTCFRCPSHPSSGVHKTLTAASGTGHITYQCNDLPPWPN